jgi:hypothetical protein
MVKWRTDDGRKPDLMTDAVLLAGARGGRNKPRSRRHTYAKRALMKIPSLEDWERKPECAAMPPAKES